MRQATATRSSLRNAFLMPSRPDIPPAKLVLSAVTLPRATPQALIETNRGRPSAIAALGSERSDPQVTASRTKRYRAALPISTSNTKGTKAVRSTPATSVNGSPITGSQLSRRHQMPQRLNQREARS